MFLGKFRSYSALSPCLILKKCGLFIERVKQGLCYLVCVCPTHDYSNTFTNRHEIINKHEWYKGEAM